MYVCVQKLLADTHVIREKPVIETTCKRTVFQRSGNESNCSFFGDVHIFRFCIKTRLNGNGRTVGIKDIERFSVFVLRFDPFHFIHADTSAAVDRSDDIVAVITDIQLISDRKEGMMPRPACHGIAAEVCTQK